jgi:hypothetical protein
MPGADVIALVTADAAGGIANAGQGPAVVRSIGYKGKADHLLWIGRNRVCVRQGGGPVLPQNIEASYTKRRTGK